MPNLPVLVYSQLHYLKTLQSRYGNLQEALAAYHMGPAQFERHAYRPRSEIRRYVNHILAKAAQLQSAQAAPHLVLYYPLYAHDFTHISHLSDIQDCALGKYGQATTSTQLTASSSPPDFSYPVRFVRISSPFSRARLHPILKQYRSHLGIDFAAPKGSPVWAAADGSVQLAGKEDLANSSASVIPGRLSIHIGLNMPTSTGLRKEFKKAVRSNTAK